MKTYAVALANLYRHTNEVYIVKASNPIEAMKKVLELPSEEPFESVEQLQQYAFDGDYIISAPVAID